ncbi:MAG: hypothetical protein KJO21_11750 [Verrucomicrobiae bacterium]|nr:hypothetical protein [Verrucomicrobiae bacterium]
MKNANHRLFAGFMILSSLIVSSCSSLIYGSGNHADVLTFGSNKQKVRRDLGEPKYSGRTREGESPLSGSHYDDFVVKGPVFEYDLYSGASMAVGMTLGLSEIIFFPKALIWRFSSYGLREVRVIYDDEDSYRWHFVTKKSG